MIANIGRTTSLILAALTLGVIAQIAPAQAPAPQKERSLTSLVPAEAVFFLERRGFDNVKQAFEASNLGQMAKDEAIQQFVNDTRVKIGQMIVKSMFDLADEESINKRQQELHQLLKPFWYKPCIMFVMPPAKNGDEPGFGLICVVDDKLRPDAKSALESLVKANVPAEGAGVRQSFAYRTGVINWEGIAKSDKDFTLPKPVTAKDLKGKTVFLASWSDPLLLVATDLPTAKAMADTLGGGKTADGNASLKRVMAKATVDQWAFRWFLDVAQLKKLALEAAGSEAANEIKPALQVLGFDKVSGIGGTCGYADNVYTRLTYIDGLGGPKMVLKTGTSYKDALAMMPASSTFMVCGNFDFPAALKMGKDLALMRAQTASQQAAAMDEELATGKKPATAPSAATKPAKLPDDVQKAFDMLEQVAANSNGNVGFFLTDLTALGAAAMGGDGGLPIAFVVGIKDAAKAKAQVEQLKALLKEESAKGSSDEEGAGTQGKETSQTTYRKTTITQIGSMVRIAVLEDRVVFGLGSDATKLALDTALDKTGGLEKDSKAQKFTTLAGDGQALFIMDLGAIAKVAWPFLAQGAMMFGEDFPLASIPSTEKMVKYLGPEVVVFEQQNEGLLMKSRGLVPLATQVPMVMPMAAFGLLADSSPAAAPAIAEEEEETTTAPSAVGVASTPAAGAGAPPAPVSVEVMPSNHRPTTQPVRLAPAPANKP